MGNKKLQVWLPLLLSIMMVIGMMIGYQLRDKTNNGDNAAFLSNAKKTSVQEILQLIKERYVDAGKADSINQIVIDDLLAHLDPHSAYIPSKYLKDANEDLQGNFQGIGIEFQVFNDTVNVVNVIKDGPGEKAGLQIGDMLVKANDTIALTGKKATNEEIRNSLRGPAGSSVKITIVRDGKPQNITVTRGNIPVPTLDAAYIIAPETGYIKINKFGDRTYEEFMQSLDKLQQQGMKKLILDLRGNGGGLLNEATAIADEFLDGDKLIVYTEGAQSPRHDYNCRKDGLFEKGKLAVLIDETSASASEILSGALQDWDRATIIGRRSFGKGLVQQQFQLSDGSAVRLTVARYYTPLGRNIQKPYTNKSKSDYDEELIDRLHNGALLKADTITKKGKAFKTPGGHIVYGGGGITPDIFVPLALDTSKASLAYIKLYYKNTLNNFVYHYYVTNRPVFQKIATAAQLAQAFNPGEKEWQLLKSIAMQRDGVDISSVSATEKNNILARMKALMGRQIARSEGFYEVYNQTDSTVAKALDVMK
ncbi:S41 family peptidase [Parasediminibacterium sp. JCM 36343]|uniref:S41 family peptidase n=1 Tax=Parasediminibacterium sp. JCM 36343 TaxID=3374279 RepID=UPI0039788C07